MVITTRNPVHAVLWLIFTFCNASGIMILMGAEFIAMILIIIYVGAVAVLFLFVVMMLNIDSTELKKKITFKTPIAITIVLFLFFDLTTVILCASKVIAPLDNSRLAIDPEISNIHVIGKLLYTDFVLPFQTSGLILFVAMMSSISLTLRSRDGVKRQDSSKQLKKNKANSLFLAKSTGKYGLKDLNYDD